MPDGRTPLRVSGNWRNRDKCWGSNACPCIPNAHRRRPGRLLRRSSCRLRRSCICAERPEPVATSDGFRAASLAGFRVASLAIGSNTAPPRSIPHDLHTSSTHVSLPSFTRVVSRITVLHRQHRRRLPSRQNRHNTAHFVSQSQ